MPNRAHQDFQWSLETYLRVHWARPNAGRVYHDINLASPENWPHDYRIPDLVLLTPARFSIDKNEYFEGPPDVVVEIHSPGDEAYEKLEFYARLGVPEVWVIHRDTKEPAIYERAGGSYNETEPAANGWIQSRVTGVELRSAPARKLAIRVTGDESTLAELPD
jgi:Uma2 family endonuclease